MNAIVSPVAPRVAQFICEKRPATGSKGMMVSNHPLASAAGSEMLLAGGNAIDAAVAETGEPVDVLFNCAGLPGPPFSDLDTMLVNFVGLRHLSEALAAKMKPGSAIASVVSVAGIIGPSIFAGSFGFFVSDRAPV